MFTYSHVCKWLKIEKGTETKPRKSRGMFRKLGVLTDTTCVVLSWQLQKERMKWREKEN